MCSVQCAVYSLQFAGCDVQCAVCCVQCAVCGVHGAKDRGHVNCLDLEVQSLLTAALHQGSLH